ncbi:MAG TPA: PAS domain-containing protein, partial [Bacteroidales bacterium]|nr:PAS domain-containing protein [Bacteroidales bacterium]
PEDYQKTMDAMRDHLMGKLPLYDVKYRIKTKDGSYKWYWDKGGIVDRTPDNKPLKLVGLVIDISENFDHTRFNYP